MAIVKVGATIRMFGHVNPVPESPKPWLRRLIDKIRRK